MWSMGMVDFFKTNNWQHAHPHIENLRHWNAGSAGRRQRMAAPRIDTHVGGGNGEKCQKIAVSPIIDRVAARSPPRFCRQQRQPERQYLLCVTMWAVDQHEKAGCRPQTLHRNNDWWWVVTDSFSQTTTTCWVPPGASAASQQPTATTQPRGFLLFLSVEVGIHPGAPKILRTIVTWYHR